MLFLLIDELEVCLVFLCLHHKLTHTKQGKEHGKLNWKQGTNADQPEEPDQTIGKRRQEIHKCSKESVWEVVEQVEFARGKQNVTKNKLGDLGRV